MGFIILKLLIGKMASKEASALSAAEHDELCCSYAALMLHDDGLDITSEKLSAVIKASGNTVEPYWPMLFAKALIAKTLEISSPKSPLLVDQEEPPQQVQLLVVMTLQRRKKRKKRRLTSIWEVFSVKRTITELSKIISHIKTT